MSKNPQGISNCFKPSDNAFNSSTVVFCSLEGRGSKKIYGMKYEDKTQL